MLVSYADCWKNLCAQPSVYTKVIMFKVSPDLTEPIGNRGPIGIKFSIDDSNAVIPKAKIQEQVVEAR